ncbi:MAG: hypothetical protein LC745_10695 [Planctomycetia bacterium]|nr:hypothetical protein [Planctomycetia bacterium]
MACDGTVSFEEKPFELGKAFRGEHVAVRPTVEDGIFGVYSGVHRVAQADLRVQNQSEATRRVSSKSPPPRSTPSTRIPRIILTARPPFLDPETRIGHGETEGQ